MSLKKKVLNYLNENKSAQGSLIAVVAASVILSVIVASATQWYLAFNKSLNVSSDSLTGMSIAKDIWDKMTTQDFEDMKGKAGTTETSDVGGYTVTREYGQAGVFDESTGECKVGSGSPTTDNPRACMDVTMKVTDKDGKQVFTATPTRVSQNLGNFYVKNDNFPKEFKVKMEDKDESVEMPEGKALYAYVDGQKVPLSSQGSNGGMFLHDWDNPISINSYSSTQDLKGIVKPISSHDAFEKLAIYSFTVTEDVIARVIDSKHSSASGSSLNGGTSYTTSSTPYFKVLYKGKIYSTGDLTSNSTSYVIYPNVK